MEQKRRFILVERFANQAMQQQKRQHDLVRNVFFFGLFFVSNTKNIGVWPNHITVGLDSNTLACRSGLTNHRFVNVDSTPCQQAIHSQPFTQTTGFHLGCLVVHQRTSEPPRAIRSNQRADPPTPKGRPRRGRAVSAAPRQCCWTVSPSPAAGPCANGPWRTPSLCGGQKKTVGMQRVTAGNAV